MYVRIRSVVPGPVLLLLFCPGARELGGWRGREMVIRAVYLGHHHVLFTGFHISSLLCVYYITL